MEDLGNTGSAWRHLYAHVASPSVALSGAPYGSPIVVCTVLQSGAFCGKAHPALSLGRPGRNLLVRPELYQESERDAVGPCPEHR